jgi:hypothetical protein
MCQELEETLKTLQDLHMVEVATNEENQGQYASVISDHTEIITALNESYC